MAKAWAEVVGSPQYQALTAEQRASAKRQYFDQVVAPRVPKAKRSVAWQQFSGFEPVPAANDQVEVAQGDTQAEAAVAPSGPVQFSTDIGEATTAYLSSDARQKGRRDALSRREEMLGQVVDSAGQVDREALGRHLEAGLPSGPISLTRPATEPAAKAAPVSKPVVSDAFTAVNQTLRAVPEQAAARAEKIGLAVEELGRAPLRFTSTGDAIDTSRPLSPAQAQAVKTSEQESARRLKAVHDAVAAYENALPQTKQWSAAGITQAVAQSAPDTVAAILAGTFGGPALAGAMMFSAAAPEEFGHRRMQGKSPLKAAEAGLVAGAAESVGEAFALPYFINQVRKLGTKGAGRLLTRISNGAIAEAPGEMLTEAITKAYGAGQLNDRMTLGEAVNDVLFAGAVGAGTGVGIQSSIEAARPIVVQTRNLLRSAGVGDQVNDLVSASVAQRAAAGKAQSAADALDAIDDIPDEKLQSASPRYKHLRAAATEQQAKRLMKDDLAEVLTDDQRADVAAAQQLFEPEAADATAAQPLGLPAGPIAQAPIPSMPVSPNEQDAEMAPSSGGRQGLDPARGSSNPRDPVVDPGRADQPVAQGFAPGGQPAVPVGVPESERPAALSEPATVATSATKPEVSQDSQDSQPPDFTTRYPRVPEIIARGLEENGRDFPDTDEQIKATHDETANEWRSRLGDMAHVRDSLAKGLDPNTGKPFKTDMKRKAVERALAEAEQEQQDSEAEYEAMFGAEARKSFRAFVDSDNINSNNINDKQNETSDSDLPAAGETSVAEGQAAEAAKPAVTAASVPYGVEAFRGQRIEPISGEDSPLTPAGIVTTVTTGAAEQVWVLRDDGTEAVIDRGELMGYRIVPAGKPATVTHKKGKPVIKSPWVAPGQADAGPRQKQIVGIDEAEKVPQPSPTDNQKPADSQPDHGALSAEAAKRFDDAVAEMLAENAAPDDAIDALLLDQARSIVGEDAYADATERHQSDAELEAWARGIVAQGDADADGGRDTPPPVGAPAAEQPSDREGLALTAQTEESRQAEEAETRRRAETALLPAERAENFQLTPQTRNEAVAEDEARRSVTAAQSGLFGATGQPTRQAAKAAPGPFAGRVKDYDDARNAVIDRPAGTWVFQQADKKLLGGDNDITVYFSTGDGRFSSAAPAPTEREAFSNAKERAKQYEVELAPELDQAESITGTKAVAQRADKSYLIKIQGWDSYLKKWGKDKAVEAARSAVAGNFIGREFGESADAFYARDAGARATRDWLAEQDGKGVSDELTAVRGGPSVVEKPSDQAPAVALSPQTALEDFGEKLGGARKDRTPALSKAATDEDIAGKPLSAIWPMAEIEAIEDPFIAAFAHAARDEVPAKPRVDYKLKRWVEKVGTLLGLVRELVSGNVSKDAFESKLAASPTLRELHLKTQLLTAIDRGQWKRIGQAWLHPDAYTYDDSGKKVPVPQALVEIDGQRRRIEGVRTLEELIPRVNEMLGVAAAPSKMKFEIRQSTKDGIYFINKAGDSERRRLKTFAELPEARKFLRDNHDELVAEWESVKERDNVGKKDVRRAENRPRTGADHRGGKDVTEQMFKDAFGFRGVEFGEWVSQGAGAKDRQGLLNQVYDALHDLAEIVGIPTQAISLNGSLGLGLGSRGSGWASAHFEPGNLVINLTKTRGAGSLAHEWFHALDNFFSRKRGAKEFNPKALDAQDAYRKASYITYKPEPLYVHKVHGGRGLTKAMLEQRRKENPKSKYFAEADWQIDPAHPQGVRPEVEKAFAGLVEALDASPMSARAKMNDKGDDGYWGRIIERAARSFENFVIARMQQKGYDNDFLANVVPASEFKRNVGRYPYLLPEEVAPVAEAFDTLFSTVKTRETEHGVELYTARSNASSFSRYSALGNAESAPEQALQDATELTGLNLGIEIEAKSLPDMPNTPAYFDLARRVIVWNTAVKSTRAEAAQYIAEELLHAVDAVGAKHTISASSASLDLNGEVGAEAVRHFDGMGELRRFLAYPLGSVNLTKSEVKAELFARLGTLYFGDPDLMQRLLPKAYEAYHGIFDFKPGPDPSGERILRQVWSGAGRSRAQVRGGLRVVGSDGRADAAGNRREQGDSGLGQARQRIAKSLKGVVVGARVQFSRSPAALYTQSISKQDVSDEALRKAGLEIRSQSVVEQFRRAMARTREATSEALPAAIENIFDQFLPIKNAEGAVDATRSGYVAARMSTSPGSVIYAVMIYGAPRWGDGVIEKKPGTEGLLQILKPVHGRLDDWAAWMVGKRAEWLMSQGRENNLTLPEIRALQRRAGDSAETFEAVAKKVRLFNNAMLELGRDGGLLSQEQFDEFSKDQYYIPFYRDEDGEVTRPWTRRGLAGQSSGIKRLKGGAAELHDPVENMMVNIGKLIDASMKNRALYRTLLNVPGIATKAQPGDKNAVRVLWKGKPHHFAIHDPSMLRALTAVGMEPSKDTIRTIGRAAKRLLTTGITADPGFMMRNFMRDSVHAWIIDKNGFRLGLDSLKGASTTLKSLRKSMDDPNAVDPVVQSMAFAGSSFIGGHVYGNDPAQNAESLRRALRKQGFDARKIDSYLGSLIKSPAELWARYRELGDAAENANRVAVARAALDAGKSMAEAMFDAKDLMDFSLRGRSAFVQVLVDVVPFFNARLQGLYKLGRATGQDRAKGMRAMAYGLAGRGMLLAMASLVLAAANDDDERYQELPDWDKDANWHLWVGDVHYRIPKPFELGYFFGTLPERMWNLSKGHDSSAKSMKSFAHFVLDTLAFNPIPQAVRPLIETFFNLDMFRGRPIESFGDEGKLPQDRFSASTSPIMVKLGEASGLSPKKLEHIYNGYLGTMGMHALAFSDWIVRSARGDVPPTRRVSDYPVIGSFVRTGPAWSTQYLDDLYDLAREAEEANRSLLTAEEAGNDARADQIIAKYARLIDFKKDFASARKDVTEMRKERDEIIADKSMSPEEKRQLLDQLQVDINKTAKEVVTDFNRASQ